ncbi:hypothetical protein [Pseudoflavonifractor gallinarum]
MVQTASWISLRRSFAPNSTPRRFFCRADGCDDILPDRPALLLTHS